MKKLVFPAVIVFLVLITVIVGLSLFFSRQNVSNGITKTEAQTLPQNSESELQKRQSPETKDNALAIIKEFAENYEPKSIAKEVIPSPPLPNEKILQAVSNLANSQLREHEKYIILIFLRLYRFHIEHFKQSYELGRDNPLTKEFFRLIQSNNYQKADFMPSYLVHNYVKENTELLNYDLIEKEMKRIEKAEEKIK